MPRMVKVPMNEAQGQGRFISEYTEYITDLQEGEAAKFILDEGENLSAIRRRLLLAAKAMGVRLGTKRSGEDLYFWLEPLSMREGETRRRRGRPPKRQADAPTLEEPVGADPMDPGS